MIDALYEYLSERPAGADAEELLQLVFPGQTGDAEFGRTFLHALLADDPRFVLADGTGRWTLADKHLFDEPLDRAPLVVVDLETTGQRPEESAITEIGAVRLEGEREVERFESLVNPGQTIPPYVASLTGISDAMVADAPGLEDVLPRFVRFARGAVLVAHNAAFDATLLDRGSREILGRPLGMPALCTFKLARRLLPEVSKASLDGLASHFGLAKGARHRALADAELTAAVLVRLLRMLKERGGATVYDLLAAQEDPEAPRRLEIHIPRAALERLPRTPGVFWLTDAAGQTLFVGQAEDVRARVLAYFTARGHLSDRQFDMILRATDVGFRRAASALERAVIEAQEVRAREPLFHRPDRHLPRGYFVKIQRRGRYPRVLVSGRIGGDGALYIGPIRSRTLADDAASLVARTFRLRTCAGVLDPAPQVEPCWLGPAGWCSSPCNAAVGDDAYRRQVDEARRALAGDPSCLRATLSAGGAERTPQNRDATVLGRLAKLHRRRHWLVNEHSYVAAFSADGGGVWVAIVIGGLCRRMREVSDRHGLDEALAVGEDLRSGRRRRRGGTFESDVSTILAHWLQTPAAAREMVVVDVDRHRLEESLGAAREELAPLIEDRGVCANEPAAPATTTSSSA